LEKVINEPEFFVPLGAGDISPVLQVALRSGVAALFVWLFSRIIRRERCLTGVGLHAGLVATVLRSIQTCCQDLPIDGSRGLQLSRRGQHLIDCRAKSRNIVDPGIWTTGKDRMPRINQGAKRGNEKHKEALQQPIQGQSGLGGD
jgi:hypothetical protein